MASINTLVQDVYRLLEEGTTEDLTDKANEFGNRLASLILDRLTPKEEKRTLRMSNIGKPDRMLWYEINRTIPKEEFNGPTYLKFLYGDIIEEVVLFLSEAAGHAVSDRQRQVTVDGIVGHIDAVIDGVLIDVKSTSPYAFKKFKDGTLRNDDPFAYIPQLSGYLSGTGMNDGAYVAVDKQNGNICVMPLEDSDTIDIHSRISYIKEVIKKDTPPDRCFQPEPMGKSGNMKLPSGCSYCPFKKECYSDVPLRKFIYSTGPVWLTHVEEEPKVYEEKEAIE
jgi:hypothetical protein